MSVYRGKRQATYRYKFYYRGEEYRGNTNSTNPVEARRIEDAFRHELRLERGGLVPHRLLKGVEPSHIEIQTGRPFVIGKEMCALNAEAANQLLREVAKITGRAHPSAKRGVVYFIGDSESGPIKIGFATDPTSRLRAIQTSNAARLEILAVIPATPAGEAHLQSAFTELRLSGEWFRRDARLLAVIDAARRGQVDIPQDSASGTSPDPERVESAVND